MFLSILIPTFNRSAFLKKNLELLHQYIHQTEYSDHIEIVISNNNSQDETHEIVSDFINNHKNLHVRYFHQTENIGLEQNALFVLKEAAGNYVMFLGDDDFIDFNYMVESIHHIQKKPDTSVIIPAFCLINVKGERIGTGRDENSKSRIYKKGFLNCFINSWRGHQLSGLIFKKNNLFQKYKEFQICNIYPFIFFVGYSCLTGNAYRLTTYPVKVTKPGQDNKAWNYGKDGLINEVFDNYRKMPLNVLQKTMLQLKFISRQPRRLSAYESKGFKPYRKAFYNIWFAKNSTFLFRIIFPFEILIIVICQKAGAIFAR